MVVNFWASWCAPCRAEAKDLNSVFEATKAQGVQFLGVDIMDDRSRAQAFVDAFAVPYPSLFDPAGRVALAFQGVNPSAIPTTVIVDRPGQVAAVFRKRVTAIELETVLRDVVAEAAAGAVAAGG
ncbi:TlpA disulfide reductase family protein [Micromonospora globbae]